jgi:hypothetical protein
MNTKHHLLPAAALLLASTLLQAQPVTMARSVPYADDAEISSKVRSECVKLQDQLAEFIREYGKANGVDVRLVDDPTRNGPGRVLEVEIVEAVSMGNAFIGHQKFTRVGGTLFDDGKQVASFRARRNSMGGAFGGYKGSCSVLGRTVKALGQDIAQWLRNPQDGGRLGDM